MVTQYGTRYTIDLSGVVSKRYRDMIIEPTSQTPFIKFSEEEGIFMIKGNSTRENIQQVYEPVISKVKCLLDQDKPLKIYLFFKNLNLGTVRILFDFLKFVSSKQKSGNRKIQITWGTESSCLEMHEVGRDFAEMYEVKFDFIEGES